MQSTGFAIGLAELIILLILGFGLLAGLVVAAIALFVVMRAKSGSAENPWTPADSVGPPKRIRLLGPTDKPVCTSARWENDELQVRSDSWATKSLFDVPLDNVEQCTLSYRMLIKTENLQGAVYPEMWCRVPEKGQFFSRGLNQKVRGSNDWRDVQIPFYLQTGQRADLLHLNLVFENAGSVKLKQIEVLAAPTKPTA